MLDHPEIFSYLFYQGDPILYSDPSYRLILWLFTFVIGTVLGSYSSAVSFRLMRGESWIFSNEKKDGEGRKAARSQCPHCCHTLSIPDLIPVFSWLFQRGCCRYCHVTIPARYPIIEIYSGLIFATYYLCVGMVQPLIVNIGFAVLLPYFIASLTILSEIRGVSRKIDLIKNRPMVWIMGLLSLCGMVFLLHV
ncbi:MAG: prepilin peptidase [Alphaproteobacteria bacterium]|nr:prepilin peptidase [Alphaproteobacteria bacterium]